MIPFEQVRGVCCGLTGCFCTSSVSVLFNGFRDLQLKLGGNFTAAALPLFFLWGSFGSQGRVAPKSAAYLLAKPAVMMGADDSDDLVTASVREPQREEPSETGNLSASPSHELLILPTPGAERADEVVAMASGAESGAAEQPPALPEKQRR